MCFIQYLHDSVILSKGKLESYAVSDMCQLEIFRNPGIPQQYLRLGLWTLRGLPGGLEL